MFITSNDTDNFVATGRLTRTGTTMPTPRISAPVTPPTFLQRLSGLLQMVLF
jgi:hypothetical protein